MTVTVRNTPWKRKCRRCGKLFKAYLRGKFISHICRGCLHVETQAIGMSDSLTNVLKRGEKRKCHKCGKYFKVFRSGVHGTSHICKSCLRDFRQTITGRPKKTVRYP